MTPNPFVDGQCLITMCDPKSYPPTQFLNPIQLGANLTTWDSEESVGLFKQYVIQNFDVMFLE